MLTFDAASGEAGGSGSRTADFSNLSSGGLTQHTYPCALRAAAASGEAGGSGSRTVDFSNLSSGSGHALDQAIDALRRDGAFGGGDGASEDGEAFHDQDDKEVRCGALLGPCGGLAPQVSSEC